jgi:hypothetical protein
MSLPVLNTSNCRVLLSSLLGLLWKAANLMRTYDLEVITLIPKTDIAPSFSAFSA